MRAQGATGKALWELLNEPITLKQFERKWKSFAAKATFPQMLQAYEVVQGLVSVEDDAQKAGALDRVIFLPENMTREAWLAKWTEAGEKGEAADA